MTGNPHSEDRDDTDRQERSSRGTYEISAGESPSEAVVRAVAARTDTAPVDLDPLYDIVDPDHLDAMCGTDDGADRVESSVTFTFHGCQVSVTRKEVSVLETDRDGR
ncbi:HalOD1 output domain-containing protein [Halorussus sp. AFM4]|uniref:HalOD1 output domain-containing protein n=1 Tax=Halorussus sp. AFM4 TaxID=3421651 RepID=UPI003EBB0DDA